MTIDIARRDTPVYALRKCLTPAHSQNLESLHFIYYQLMLSKLSFQNEKLLKWVFEVNFSDVQDYQPLTQGKLQYH